ncbi:MAG: MTAP family purine nucleoside phosphorylase [Dehalococcoidia bacterium]|nr:MTAP family purine nucleoside phosphorylase [Dehalococcoidia bacterium]
MTRQIALAVIGGSGFYEMPGLHDVEQHRIATPFGPTSDPIRTGTLEGRKVAFLSRHGTGHRLLPREIPQLANFWALKHLGARRVLGVSAVGSLQAAYRPGDMLVPDQLIDRTRHERPETFFGEGVVGHVSLAEPFDAELGAKLADSVAEEAGGVAQCAAVRTWSSMDRRSARGRRASSTARGARAWSG